MQIGNSSRRDNICIIIHFAYNIPLPFLAPTTPFYVCGVCVYTQFSDTELNLALLPSVLIYSQVERIQKSCTVRNKCICLGSTGIRRKNKLFTYYLVLSHLSF